MVYAAIMNLMDTYEQNSIIIMNFE